MPEFPSSLSVTGDCPECGCGDPACKICPPASNPAQFFATIHLNDYGIISYITGSPTIDPPIEGYFTCAGGNHCIKYIEDYPTYMPDGSPTFDTDFVINTGWIAIPCFGFLDGQTVTLNPTDQYRCHYTGASTLCTASRTYTDEFGSITTYVAVQVFFSLEESPPESGNYILRINSQTYTGQSPFVPPSGWSHNRTHTYSITPSCDESGFVSASVPFNQGPILPPANADLNPAFSGTVIITI